MVYAKPKIRGLLLMIWFGRCHEKGIVLTQKCGADQWIIGANIASVSANYIFDFVSQIER